MLAGEPKLCGAAPRRFVMKDEATFIQGSGAYRDCRWCHGRGCLQCPEEYEKAALERAKPILTAKIDNPAEMEEMRRVVGVEALEKAFGPGGDGIREIELNAAIVNLTRVLRRAREKE